MKYLLLIIVTSLTFAKADFLSPDKATEVARFLDNICMDTYCGGDINFYSDAMTCDGNVCEVSYRAYGFSKGTFDEQTMLSLVGTESKRTNTITKFGSVSKVIHDGEKKLEAKFKCVLNNLPTTDMSEYDKEDLVYELVVTECIDAFETAVYAW